MADEPISYTVGSKTNEVLGYANINIAEPTSAFGRAVNAALSTLGLNTEKEVVAVVRQTDVDAKTSGIVLMPRSAIQKDLIALSSAVTQKLAVEEVPEDQLSSLYESRRGVDAALSNLEAAESTQKNPLTGKDLETVSRDDLGSFASLAPAVTQPGQQPAAPTSLRLQTSPQ